MARVDVVMPQMGESIAEGTMSRWLKKVGDSVRRDEPLFEISTDKVDAEIPAASAGVLVEVLVSEGQTVPVQTVVARLETDAAAAAATVVTKPSDGSAGRSDKPGATGTADGKAAATTSPPPAQVHGGAAVRQALSARTQTELRPGSLEERLRTRSSPLVRRIAAEHGLDLAGLRGSGIAGRVTKKDIMAVIEGGGTAQGVVEVGAGGGGGGGGTVAPSMWAPSGFGYEAPRVDVWPGDKVEPMSKIRRLTAGHMVYSKHTSAHVTSFFEVDLTRVARLRQKFKGEFEKSYGEKLTFLPFIAQAVVQGLAAFPVLNSAVRGTDIVFRRQYNIGIAVALDWGLIVPVVKGADTMNIAGLTKAINDVAGRARSKRLKPEDVQDATFTITNPGVFGSVMGTPIIPQPTVAIMGVGAIEKRPRVMEGPDGEDVIAIRTCCFLSLSFDHRIVDGADADRFMAFVRDRLENTGDTL
ncbi:MAG: dihydrolipoamide acetyltransferase family protein [Gemmatimonadota bacterium]